MNPGYLICALQNASKKINGIKFVDHPDGVISAEPLSAEQLVSFQGIHGYRIQPLDDVTKVATEELVKGPIESDAAAKQKPTAKKK